MIADHYSDFVAIPVHCVAWTENNWRQFTIYVVLFKHLHRLWYFWFYCFNNILPSFMLCGECYQHYWVSNPKWNSSVTRMLLILRTVENAEEMLKSLWMYTLFYKHWFMQEAGKAPKKNFNNSVWSLAAFNLTRATEVFKFWAHECAPRLYAAMEKTMV